MLPQDETHFPWTEFLGSTGVLIPEILWTKRFHEDIESTGLHVSTFTTNDPERVIEEVAIGNLYTIFTDNPKLLNSLV